MSRIFAQPLLASCDVKLPPRRVVSPISRNCPTPAASSHVSVEKDKTPPRNADKTIVTENSIHIEIYGDVPLVCDPNQRYRTGCVGPLFLRA